MLDACDAIGLEEIEQCCSLIFQRAAPIFLASSLGTASLSPQFIGTDYTPDGKLLTTSNNSGGIPPGIELLTNLINVIDPTPSIGGDFMIDGATGPDYCEDGTSLATAIGCIPTDSYSALFAKLLGFSIGIAGGIAFLMILVGGLKVLMSTGNPEKLEEGKDQIQSALVGLMLVIFSVFILQLIGVEMLHIPGFG